MEGKNKPFNIDSVDIRFGGNGWEGKISKDFNGPQLRDLLQQGSQIFSQPGIELISRGRNRVGILSISRPDGSHENLVIKEFRVVGIDRLKTLGRPSKAHKAWQGAMNLLAHQISTPFPVAFLEKRRRGFIDKAIFITRMIPDAPEIRGLLRERRGEALRALLKDLAEFLRQVHHKNLLHHDLSDGNILVEEKGEKRKFYLLDTNRLQKKKKLSSWKAIKSLIRVGVPPEEQKFFLQSYLGLSRLPFHRWVWYKVNKECFNLFLRVKNFLRLRNIVQRLRLQ